MSLGPERLPMLRLLKAALPDAASAVFDTDPGAASERNA